MARAHLWYVIGFDDKELTPASHQYARVVVRWLKVSASYAGRLNLTVITSGTVLEQSKTWRIALSPR